MQKQLELTLEIEPPKKQKTNEDKETEIETVIILSNDEKKDVLESYIIFG